MEFKCETAYNQEAVSDMAKAIRKTARRKRSKRSHIFGVIVIILALLLTLPLGDKAFVFDFRTIFTWFVAAILFFTLIFEDKINGYVARKRMLPGLAKAIVTFTTSGHTARMVSKFRPQCPIIATTEDEGVMRRLALVWGVYPVKTSHVGNTDDLFTSSISSAKEKKYLENGDLVVITAGVPSGISGTTNLIKVHTIEE